MTRKELQNKCRGSLVGGAVGDALGYAVEFSPLYEIQNKYGEKGIVEYELNTKGVAEFSDDTQMSLFTAEGLLTAVADGKGCIREICPYISKAYEHWYATQTRPVFALSRSWLSYVASLWSDRAPGTTCMSSLYQLTLEDGLPVVNNSKGCGGVMRVAPIGIFSAAHPELINFEDAGFLAGYAAEVTHKHKLSTYSSVALAMIVSACLGCEAMDRDTLRVIIVDKVFKLLELYFREDKNLDFLYNRVLKAMALAESNESDPIAIRQLGEGWVAEETLAIAIFSVIRYINDFEKCIVCSVNHSGDSDSTGAVAGNIIGAIVGYNAIPDKYKINLELHDLLVTVADDLAGASTDEQIKERYVHHKPYGISLDLLI